MNYKIFCIRYNKRPYFPNDVDVRLLSHLGNFEDTEIAIWVQKNDLPDICIYFQEILKINIIKKHDEYIKLENNSSFELFLDLKCIENYQFLEI